MENDYPEFKSRRIKREYTQRINHLFKENNFDWTAYPASRTYQIFVMPKRDLEWEEFPDVSRIGVRTEEGVFCLGINGLSSMKTSPSKEILENKGYIYQDSDCNKQLCWLTKPLKNLGSLVEELKNITPVLLKK
jgi:hypothetical protein